MSSPRAGQVIGDQLKLVAPIGAGAMGSVWSAHDEKLDRMVAVKFMAASYVASSDALARFKREAALAAKLRSPHVVQVLSHGVTSDEAPFMVMELLEGRSLAAATLDGPRMSLTRVVEIVQQISRGLAAAHALGIVHRDIKPANLFLVEAAGYDVFVKLVDFGIARSTEDDEATLTATGAVIGTPRYMSPEQMLGGRVDHQADLWATAVVAYELVVGHAPFEGSTPGAIAVSLEARRFRAPSEVVDALGSGLDAWFARAFAKDASERFDSAEALAASFKAAAFALTVGSDATIAVSGASKREVEPAQLPASAAAPRPRSRALWALPGVVVAGGLVLVGRGLTLEEPSRANVEASSSADSASASPASASAVATSTSASVSATLLTTATSARAPRTRGRLAPELIQAVVRKHQDAILRCRRTLKDGQVTVRTLYFVIDVDGRPRDVAVFERDGVAPDVDRCLEANFQAMVFPKPEGGIVTVNYPYFFSVSGAPHDDAACAPTPGCVHAGRCTGADVGCVVANDRDCRLAEVCVEQGRCTAVKGTCEARHTDCSADGDACKSFGLCHAESGTCRALTDEDCVGSDACALFGRCAAEDGLCVVADDERCAASRTCKERGRCSAGSSSCVAETASMCALSAVCTRDGQCAARAGVCAALEDRHCRESAGCTDAGLCGLGKGGRCAATSAADCKASKECEASGNCKLGEFGTCAR